MNKMAENGSRGTRKLAVTFERMPQLRNLIAQTNFSDRRKSKERKIFNFGAILQIFFKINIPIGIKIVSQ
jgi:hypothetical protein